MIVQADPRSPRVVLIGPPGSGKSTIGRRLARELGVDLYDTDQGIEREAGRPIPEIFAVDGEAEFRKIEERVVRRAILAEKGVVSLGGGAVLSRATRALLRNRTVVYLEISVGEGMRRTGVRNVRGDASAAGRSRPMLKGADPVAKYRELMRLRRPLYREVATIRVRTEGRSPGRVVGLIVAKLQAHEGQSTPSPAMPVAAPGERHRHRRPRRRRGAGAASLDGQPQHRGEAE